MHPLERRDVVAEIERAVTSHLGRAWSSREFRNLDVRASHPCGIHCGDGFDVFAKFKAAAAAAVDAAADSAEVDVDGAVQFDLECRGLRLLHDHGARTVQPVADGVLRTQSGSVLLLVAETERAPKDRMASDWQAIGRALGELHGVHADTFGLLGLDGFFGPLPQDNRPVASNRWIDFFRERRIERFLDVALRSGQLPPEFATRIDQLVHRLPSVVGPEPVPTLLHGDAQQNNYLSTDDGAVFVDASPFFGHPENDLAMIDIFEPVPTDVFNGYRDVRPIDAGFAERRELWRVPVYLAIIAVGGGNAFGQTFVTRLDDALRSFR